MVKDCAIPGDGQGGARKNSFRINPKTRGFKFFICLIQLADIQ